MRSPLKNELKQRRSESTKVEGRAKNHWLHPISIQSKGSMTKNRWVKTKDKDQGLKDLVSRSKPKPKLETKTQETRTKSQITTQGTKTQVTTQGTKSQGPRTMSHNQGNEQRF